MYFFVRFFACALALALAGCSMHGQSVSPGKAQHGARTTSSISDYFTGEPATPENRDATLAGVPGAKQPLSKGRDTKAWVNHYQCTDWLRYNRVSGEWDYDSTTCQYMDSFFIPDGGGIVPGGGRVTGPGGTRNADALLKSCGTFDPATPSDKTAIDKAANTAAFRFGSANPGYEYAGFVVKGPGNQIYYTQGQLVPIGDDLTGYIGSKADHQANLRPGFEIVAIYHTHPGTSPSQTDVTTGTHFSVSDVAYADYYDIDIYVMDLWNDTSSGTSVEKTSFYRYDHDSDGHKDKDVNSSGRC